MILSYFSFCFSSINITLKYYFFICSLFIFISVFVYAVYSMYFVIFQLTSYFRDDITFEYSKNLPFVFDNYEFKFSFWRWICLIFLVSSESSLWNSSNLMLFFSCISYDLIFYAYKNMYVIGDFLFDFHSFIIFYQNGLFILRTSFL